MYTHTHTTFKLKVLMILNKINVLYCQILQKMINEIVLNYLDDENRILLTKGTTILLKFYFFNYVYNIIKCLFY